MITIREATKDDLDFIAAHAYRLLEFGPPPWRPDTREMTAADIGHLNSALLSTDPFIAVFIAVDETDTRCGFIHLTLQPDYYTKKPQAHITDIVVTAAAEGKGVGKALLTKSEDWAKDHQATWITLNAFEGNERARKVYEKAGYQVEWVRYLKELK